MTATDLWATLRPAQWLKNGFVLAAVVFSLNLTDAQAVARSLAAFVVFCLASSAAYVGNDILDAERDALHESKRGRPIAAGRISKSSALGLCGGLVGLAMGGAAALGAPMLACVGAFLALQAAYSTILKHIPVIDAASIAMGFVLRAAAGVVAAGAKMSAWLFLATFLLALFLALGKRRAELSALGDRAVLHRPALALYQTVPLDPVIVTVALLVVGLYTQYTLSIPVAERLGTERLYLSVPFVVCGVFRYLFLIYGRNQGGNPTGALLGDGPLRATVVFYVLTVVVLIYG